MLPEATFDSPELEIARLTVSQRLLEVSYPAICCFIVLACILLANPFTPAAFLDDWSYADVALRFAETGRLHYNGWGSPMILFQTIWGAAWIRAFGFSFNVLRIATIPFSLGFLWLVYLIGRRAGLAPLSATFGALLVGTSPLFFPLAASFMTEPYACFFTALCLYAALRAAETPSSRAAAVWLWILTIAGIVGGSDRQSVWAAPVALIPYLCWKRRCPFSFRFHTAAAYALCVASIGLLVHNFTQPYGPLVLPHSQITSLLTRGWLPALGRLCSLSLACFLVALPALLCFSSFWKNFEPAVIVLLLLGSIAVVMVLTSFGVGPFSGDILTPFGILWEGENAPGPRPILLSLKIRIALSVLVAFSTAALFCSRNSKRAHSTSSLWPIVAVYSVVYLLLLVPALLATWSFDRYALPLLPGWIIWVLMRFTRYKCRLPAAAWACAAVFACYSVMTTHDFSSSLRARYYVARMLEARGIPRNRISAGVEYDGWTQIQETGRIDTPRSTDRAQLHPTEEFWFWTYATHLHPDYVLAYSQLPGARGGLPALSFETWLPPSRRYVTAFRRTDLAAGISP